MKTISYYSACKVTYKASVSGCPLIVGHWLSPFSTRSPCQRHLVVQMTNDTLRLWKPSISGICKAVGCRLFSHFAIMFQDWCTNRFKCALIHLCNLSSSGSGGHSLNYYLFIFFMVGVLSYWARCCFPWDILLCLAQTKLNNSIKFD